MKVVSPAFLILVTTVLFMVMERLFPGRELPNAKGWYLRALLISACQIGITFWTNDLWVKWLSSFSLLQLSNLESPVIQGFLGWLVGTFFFYWWHRIRHLNGFWQIFHQLHHSPSRIETLTSFYKHPLEILSDSLLAALILYCLLGCSLEGAIWFNFFAATGEYFYHSNIKTPKWLKYIIQTPELHSIHHQLDLHKHNYSDLPIWDKLFGTYKDTDDFAPQCGFPKNNEAKIAKMLLFKDVYHD